LGCLACVNLGHYAHHVEGVIYKPLFRGLYRGLLTVFICTLIVQVLLATNISVQEFGPTMLLVFGGKVGLSGTVSTQKAGEPVDALAQQCGASSAQKAGTVQTATGGAYTLSLQPLANTTYTTKLRSASSTAVTVRVRPRLVLTRVAAHRYTVRAYAGESLAGKYAGIQRYNATTRRWVSVKVLPLKAGAGATAPAVVSTASVRLTFKTRVRLRATLGQAQVGTCYAAGSSNTILS